MDHLILIRRPSIRKPSVRRPSVNSQEKRTCHRVNFAVLAEHKVKIKDEQKLKSCFPSRLGL